MLNGPPVDAEIYEAIAKETSPDFAFSYLIKAVQRGGVIEPHTLIAWERITENAKAMKEIQKRKLILKKPQPWQPGRDEPIKQPLAA